MFPTEPKPIHERSPANIEPDQWDMSLNRLLAELYRSETPFLAGRVQAKPTQQFWTKP